MHHRVELGNTIVFQCTVDTNKNLSSVIWFKHYELILNHTINTKNLKNMSEKIVHEFKHRDKESIIYFNANNITALLKFKSRTINDAGCLTCAFFAKTRLSTMSCVHLSMKPIIALYYRHLQNFLDVTCSVTSYPKPLVAILFLDKIYRQDSPTVRENYNGSQTTTLSFLFKRQGSNTFFGKPITCLSYGGEIDENVTSIIQPFENPYNDTILSDDSLKQSELINNDLAWIILIISSVLLFVIIASTLLCKLGTHQH